MTIRVLVADDQSLVRAGLPDAVLRRGRHRGRGRGGQRARGDREGGAFDPDVVLMDIRMPELDGLAATRQILATDEDARILILTTFDLDEYVYEALRAGASGFVLKDEPPEQLLAAIHTIAAGDALLSPAVTRRVIEQFTRIPRPDPPKELDELTARELEILRLIASGLSNAEIGQELFISETTVKTHVTHVLAKLGLRDRVQAVVLAYQTGIFDPESLRRDGEPPRTDRPYAVAMLGGLLEAELLDRELAHPELLDLPRHRHRERVDELPVARDLVGRDLPAAGGDERPRASPRRRRGA